MVHISDEKMVPAKAKNGMAVPNFKLHLCKTCAAVYHQEVLANSNCVNSKGLLIEERVRVVSITPERTVLRIIRTETNQSPQDWCVLTSRLPQPFWPVGEEISLSLTPLELEFLKGN